MLTKRTHILLINRLGSLGPTVTFSVLLLFVLLISSPVYAQTSVSGTISANETWTVENSPYTVTGHVTVASGVTLTIEPGVTVKFDAGKVLEIEGELIAQGTSSDKITFTSSAASPAAGDWGYIKFEDSSTDAAFDNNGNYSSGSILEHCTVEYGGAVGMEQDTANIKSDDASPFINNCTIQHSRGNGVYISPGSAYKFTNNTLAGNSVYGVKISGDTDGLNSHTPTISGNTVINNGVQNGDGGGIYVYGGDNLGGSGNGYTFDVINNTLNGNLGDGVIQAYGENFTISQNEVTENTTTGILAIGYGNATIEDNLVKDGNGTSWGMGMQVKGKSNAVITVSNNKIIDNIRSGSEHGGTGIFAQTEDSSSITIDNNIIQGNDSTNSNSFGKYGAALLLIASNDNLYVTNNTISGNIGASAINSTCYDWRHYSVSQLDEVCWNRAQNYPQTANISNNNFINNYTTYLLTNLHEYGSDNLNAENNWWGTTNSLDIQTNIIDWNDYASLGVINYATILTTPNTTAPPSPPSGVAVQTGPTSIAFTWTANPESDITGYKLHYDTDAAGYPYANSVDVGNVTSYTLTNLSMGTTYYSAISAYDGDGNESWVSSNNTSSTISPTLVFTTQPGGGILGSNMDPQPVVTIQDDQGNTITNLTADITVSITSGTEADTYGSTLTGTTTVAVVNGVATFTDLRVDQISTVYTLTPLPAQV